MELSKEDMEILEKKLDEYENSKLKDHVLTVDEQLAQLNNLVVVLTKRTYLLNKKVDEKLLKASKISRVERRVTEIENKYNTLNQYCLDIDQSVAEYRDEIENKEVAGFDELHEKVERLDGVCSTLAQKLDGIAQPKIKVLGDFNTRLKNLEKKLDDVEEQHQNDVLETIQKVLNKVQSDNKPWIDKIEDVARLNQTNHRHLTQLINDVVHSVGDLRKSVGDFRKPEESLSVGVTDEDIERMLNELFSHMGMAPHSMMEYAKRSAILNIVREHIEEW